MAFLRVVALICCLLPKAHSIPISTQERSKRSDDSAPLQTVVDNLAQRVAALEAKYTAQQTKLDTYETVVAFEAKSDSSVSVAPRGTIIFPHIITNVGNAYDPRSGFFTAPVSGLYQFHATFMDNDHTGSVWAEIDVDGTRVAYGVSETRTGYWDSPTLTATVHVTKGQVVRLRSANNDPATLHGGFLWFSGFLIRAD